MISENKIRFSVKFRVSHHSQIETPRQSRATGAPNLYRYGLALDE